MGETEQPVVPVVKWGSSVLISREMLGLPPAVPTLLTAVRDRDLRPWQPGQLSV